MNTKKTLLSVCVLATLFACNNESEQLSNNKTDDGVITINSTVGSMAKTRATGDGTALQDNAFQDNAEINVYLSENGGSSTTYPQPLTYKYNSSSNPNMTLTGTYAGNTYYFPNNGNGVDAYAIYPTTSFASGITIAADQKSDTDYKSNDWMFGTNNPTNDASFAGTKKGSTIQLTFKHIMSKIVVKLVPGDGVTEDDLNNATIKMFRALPETSLTGLSVNGYTLGTATGTAPAGGYEFGTRNSTNGNSIIIVPQTITADTSTPLFQVTIGSGTYSYCLSTEKEFKGGNSYIYTFNLSSAGLTVETITVTDWNKNDMGEENITLD